MHRIEFILLLTFQIISFTELHCQFVDTSITNAMKRIENSSFAKHLNYLTSDQLAGRGVGSVGYDKAADYMANELKSYRLLPFGDSGTYFQQISFIRPTLISSSFNFSIEDGSNKQNGSLGKDISILVGTNQSTISTRQQLVFAGYGNIIPTEKIDDYQGLDVRGTTVIVAVGGPKGIKNPAFEDILVKIHNAKHHGASGIILFYPERKLFQNLIFRYVHSFLTQSALHYADTSIHGSIIDVNLSACTYAKLSFIKKLFKLSRLNFNSELSAISIGEYRSRELPITMDCSYSTKNELLKSMNIVAIIPGCDPILKDEYIILGAHLDHLGVGKKIRGDSIYNGMLDNASGCSALLSIAKAFSQMPEKPKRSLVFIGFTAEEAGLFGSHFFVSRNNIKNGKIVAYLNIDMVANLFETINIYPVGYLHSNMAEALDFATNKLQMNISATKSLDENYLERGDQFSFIRKGIPSLYLIPGNTSLDPNINGYRRTNRWLRKFYHSPFDDLKQPFSANAFVTGTKLNFLTLYYLSNNIDEIRWNNRSWVYDKYLGSKR